MVATMIDGKGLAQVVLDNLRAQLSVLPEPLHIAAVCVGDDAGLKGFVKIKQKTAQSVGIEFSSYFFDADDQEGARQTLAFLAGDESVHGIFVEMPLPSSWDARTFLALIPADKDVDALTAGAPVPEPAVLALEHVCIEHDIVLPGLSVAVVGQGALVGAPIARWLAERGARVVAIDEHTPNASALSARADMVIAGVGKPGLVNAGWVKDDAVVVDFGYGKNNAGQYVGDVDQASVTKKARLLSPVPGGMGPLVVAAVLENLLTLATNQQLVIRT